MIGAANRSFVRQRAGNCCEYCRAEQDDYDLYTFHIEHVIPRQHGGSDDLENLCLACPSYNAAKGTNLTGLLEGRIVPLFHPRRQSWNRHFYWDGCLVVGRTLAGKVTVRVLKLNEQARLIVRQSLIDERFPRDGE